MRIFFVGAFYPGSVVSLRAQALKELGNSVELFNTYPYEMWGGKYLNYGLRKTKILEINHLLMNTHLAERAIKSNPDILWIDKGRYIDGNTIRKIRKQTNAVVIYETLDYMFAPFNKTAQFMSSIPEYDIVVTMRRDDAQYYEHGAKKVLRLYCGVYEPLYKKVSLSEDEKKTYSSDVAFIGTPEEERAQSIAFLIKNGIKLKVWGKLDHWKRMKCFSTLKPFFVDSFLVWDDYVKALNGAKIGLCFLQRASQDEHTLRSIEIPACGCFMLAERTRDHMDLFKEDEEAAFFSDNEEMLDKVRFYLKNSEKRDTVAATGRQRCVSSNYFFHWKYKKVLDEAAKL